MQDLEAMQQRINEAVEDLAAAMHGAARQRFVVPGQVPQQVVDRYGEDFAHALNGTIIIHHGPAKVGDQVLAGRIASDGSPVILRPAVIVDDSADSHAE